MLLRKESFNKGITISVEKSIASNSSFTVTNKPDEEIAIYDLSGKNLL